MGTEQLVRFDDIVSAYSRIKSGIKLTELSVSEKLSEEFKMEVLLKHDYRQYTGGFKERGALNFLLTLSKEQRERGVVAASSGNHAFGLSYHGKRLSIPVTVFLSEVTPKFKIEKCKKLGANVIVSGKNFDEAKCFALKYAEENHLTYANGINDIPVIAGQGTMLLEIAQQTQNLDAIVVPVGGGGLISGIAVAANKLFPNCEIIGVEPVSCDSMNKALQAKHPVTLETDTSLTVADGLSVKRVGDNPVNIMLPLYSRMLQVEEIDIFKAICKLIEYERCIVEGAAATGIAALVAGKLNHLQHKRVAFLLCGANIDSLTLINVIDKVLFSSNRLAKVSLLVKDRPGGILPVIQMLNDFQINIRDISKERVSSGTSVYLCKISMCLEFQTSEQFSDFKIALYDQYGPNVEWSSI